MGARWYNPSIGRWISPDSIVPQPGNPQDFNRYMYVRGNPLKYTDPTGHYTFKEDPDDFIPVVRSFRNFTKREEGLMAQTAYSEVENIGSPAQARAVMWIILNRRDNRNYPESIGAVIGEPGEFFTRPENKGDCDPSEDCGEPEQSDWAINDRIKPGGQGDPDFWKTCQDIAHDFAYGDDSSERNVPPGAFFFGHGDDVGEAMRVQAEADPDNFWYGSIEPEPGYNGETLYYSNIWYRRPLPTPEPNND